MEHANYLYYCGVLRNLYKHKNYNNDNLNRAIKAINEKLKEFETAPKKNYISKLLQEHYKKNLPEAIGLKL